MPLKKWNIDINYGIKTGFNGPLEDGGCFIITDRKRLDILANCNSPEEAKRTDELIRPVLRGRDIKRYGYQYAGLYVITTFPSLHVDINEYPAIRSHLLSFGKERLEQTGKVHNVKGQLVTARKKTNNLWFETSDTIAYWEDFLKHKIVYPDIMRMPQSLESAETYPYFHFDTEGYYIEATNFMITGSCIDLIFLFISSDIGFFVFSKYFAGPQFDETGFRYKKAYLSELVIPRIDSTSAKNLRSLLLKLSKSPAVTSRTINKEFQRILGLTKEESDWISGYKRRLLRA